MLFASVIHSNGPLRKHRLSSVGSKVTSSGCNNYNQSTIIGWFRPMLLILYHGDNIMIDN